MSYPYFHKIVFSHWACCVVAQCCFVWNDLLLHTIQLIFWFWFALASFHIHFESGLLPRAPRKVLWGVIDSHPQQAWQYHRDYETTWEMSQLLFFFGPESIPSVKIRCSELHVFLPLPDFSATIQSGHKLFSCFHLCQQLVLIRQTASVYLWSLISSEM